MRPMGVTLIAIWYWIRGAAWALCGLGTFLFAKILGSFMDSMPGWMTGLWHTLGFAFAFVLFALAVLDFAIGGGLMGMKKWAANLAIALSGFHALIGVGSVFSHPLHIFGIVPFAINVAVVVFLLLPAVRASFR